MEEKIYVFDWDGTLADSTGRIVHAFMQAFDGLNTQPPAEQSIRDIIGLSLPVAVAHLVPDADAALQARLVQAYRQHYFTIEEPVTLYPGAMALLETLNEQGHFVTIATGKSTQGLVQAIEQTQTADLIHYTQTAEQTRSKPHPLMLERIADFCGQPVQALMMIGDTDFDIQMAKHAGCHAVAVSHGAHQRPRLEQAEPHWIAEDLQELSDYLVVQRTIQTTGYLEKSL